MENRSFSDINKDCWYKEICTDDCERCSRYYIIKKLMLNSGVPLKLHHPIPLECNQTDYMQFVKLNRIREEIDQFVNAGNNLYLCSEHTGNGKTSWALKIMYKFFSLNWDNCDWTEPLALFIRVPEFIISLKDFNNPVSTKYLEAVKKVPLIIWDDIGMGLLTAYDYMQLSVYLDNRIQGQLSNIYTSNIITEQELAEKIGDRLASRVLGTSEIIQLNGGDRRGSSSNTL